MRALSFDWTCPSEPGGDAGWVVFRQILFTCLIWCCVVVNSNKTR